MTPERWQEIERLYHAALARDTGERAAFLTETCGGDHELRREVESLFDYQAQARDFIERPAVHGRLASAVRRLEESFVPGRFVGRVFGSYELKALIAGVPLVLVPLGRDQPDNAARVVHAGAGIRLRKNASVSALRAAVARVIEDPRYRAAAGAMAARLDAERDDNRVVDELEQVAVGGPTTGTPTPP